MKILNDDHAHVPSFYWCNGIGAETRGFYNRRLDLMRSSVYNMVYVFDSELKKW